MMGKNFDNPFGELTPKGALKKMSAILDGAVFPGTQGGPLMHVIAGKAVAFGEDLKPEYKTYCGQVISNAQALAKALMAMDYQIISGGTDNHLMLIDLRNKGITGKAAEQSLVEAEITANKNMVPFDTESPFTTSGIRLGTAAITSRGLKEAEMIKIASLIDRVIQNPTDAGNLHEVKKEVHTLMQQFPLVY